MSWYVHPSKQLRDDELPPELVVTNRDGSITQVYEPFRGECHDCLGEREPFECSECHRRTNDTKWPNYCWYCGAKVVDE